MGEGAYKVRQINSYWRLLIAVILGLSLSACSTDASSAGDYIASDDSTALLIQIRSVQDSKVEGVFTTVSISKKGGASSRTIPLSGTLKSGSLNLLAQNGTGLFSTSIPMTGSLSGDEMKLTMLGSDKPATIAFRRSAANEFPKIVERLSQSSAAIRTEIGMAKDEQARQSRVASVQSGIDRIASQLPQELYRLEGIPARVNVEIARYGQMVKRIGELRRARASLTDSSDEVKDRMEHIDDEIQRIKDLAEHTHDQIQSGWERAQSQRDEWTATIIEKIKACNSEQRLLCAALNGKITALQIAVGKFGEVMLIEQKAFAALSQPSG